MFIFKHKRWVFILMMCSDRVQEGAWRHARLSRRMCDRLVHKACGSAAQSERKVAQGDTERKGRRAGWGGGQGAPT